MRSRLAILGAVIGVAAILAPMPAAASSEKSVEAVVLPTIYAPVGNITINTTRPTIAWYSVWPADPLVAYRIRLCSNDSYYGMLVYDSGIVSGTTPNFTVTSAPPTGVRLYPFVWEKHASGSEIGPSPTGTGGFTISTSMPGPAPLVSLAAAPADHQITLSWRNPSSASFTGTMIRYKTTGCPISATDGTLLVDRSAAPNSNDSYTHAGLGYGTYYYSAFAHNATPNYATPLYAMAIPVAPDDVPPGQVVAFHAVKGSGRNVLSWRNPSADGDFVGTMIRYKTTGYPTGPTNGTLLCNRTSALGAPDSYVHSGTSPSATYYYSAFTYDEVPNYSAGVQRTAVALTQPCLRIHPENPHYFQDIVTGQAVMITGFQAIVPSALDYDYVARDAELMSWRMRYARVWHFLPWSGANAIWPWGRSGATGAPMGGNKIDMTTWNDTYWARMRDALVTSNDGGMVGEIHLFDRCGMSWTSNWHNNPWASDNNINNLGTPPASSVGVPDFYSYSSKANLRTQQERYIRKMIDETIIYPNVIYEVENEHQSADSAGWADHYAQFIRDYITANYPSSPRLVSYSTIVSDDDLDSCFSMPALDIVNKHIGSSGASSAEVNAYLEPRWSYNKAINVDEFANGLGDAATLRDMCWAIVSSGGNFHIEDCGLSAQPYDVIENIRSFVAQSGWDFIHAAPNKSLITSGFGYCMAQPGVEYVCYCPPTPSVTITLATGSYRVEWWDTANGGFRNVSSISHSGGSRTLTPPDANPWVLHITTQPAPTTVLEAKQAGAVTIDGSPGDWDLGQFSNTIAAGNAGTGQVALIGYDSNGVCYQGNHAGGLQYPPSNAADHSARVYSRSDADGLYFLVRCDDDDVRYPDPVSSNSSNDCVEILIDPGHDHGSSTISNSSSDIDLVIDAANQKNIYNATSAYKAQVLAGLTSAVTRDSTGWWLEVRIQKSAFSPAIPATGTVGFDLCFRDNDGNNDSAKTTLYTWRDPSNSGFPSKVADRWGDLNMAADTTAPGPVTGFTAIQGNERNFLTWNNPPDSDFYSVRVLYRTTGYPSSPTDGTLVYQGTGTGCTHTGLANGQVCYYAAYTFDAASNYSTAAQASGTPAYFSPVQAKLCADNTEITLTAGTVSAVFADSFYVQCTDQAHGVCGIRVARANSGVQIGQSATVKGTILTDPATGERYISATWVSGG